MTKNRIFKDFLKRFKIATIKTVQTSDDVIRSEIGPEVKTSSFKLYIFVPEIVDLFTEFLKQKKVGFGTEKKSVGEGQRNTFILSDETSKNAQGFVINRIDITLDSSKRETSIVFMGDSRLYQSTKSLVVEFLSELESAV